ncbi:uncharacterized protein TNCV_2623071 [Trichonephila clavipes]|nr:uncharacterized protein TNCV_2623071 [Trichonephila clavipes]
MPLNTLRVHTEYVLVKSVDPKSCGLSQERRDWRIFPSPSVHAEIVEVEIGGVAIYRPLGEFRRAKSYCHLYDAQGQRQARYEERLHPQLSSTTSAIDEELGGTTRKSFSKLKSFNPV